MFGVIGVMGVGGGSSLFWFVDGLGDNRDEFWLGFCFEVFVLGVGGGKLL